MIDLLDIILRIIYTSVSAPLRNHLDVLKLRARQVTHGSDVLGSVSVTMKVVHYRLD